MQIDRRRLLACAALAGAMAPLLARAQASAGAYPQRTVKVILSNAVGGALDGVARSVTEPLARQWKQGVVLEARPGANGLIGSTFVARSPADGYTMLASNSGFIQASALNPATGLKAEELIPICIYTLSPAAFAIDANIPARTLGEFMALVKANPKKYSFGTWGVGSSGHFLGELLNRAAGTDLLHVGYNGEAAAINGLLGAQTSAAFASSGSLARQLAGGRIRILALANPHRLSSYPELPTFAEAGYASVDLPGWMGFFFPAGVPSEIVNIASAEIVRIGKDPEVVARLQGLGSEPYLLGVAESAAFVRKQYQKWGEVAAMTGVKTG